MLPFFKKDLGGTTELIQTVRAREDAQITMSKAALEALLTRSSQALTLTKTGNSQGKKAIAIRQSMMSQQTCLCCDGTLLRHIHLGRLNWRCSHCYQEMPV